jgi:hypothetical protein
VAVDLGLPGVITYLAPLLGALYATWRAWQQTRLLEKDGFLNSLALGLLGGQTALFVHGLLDATAWANKLAVIPWFIMGLAMAAARLTSDGPPSSLDPFPTEVDH